MLKAAIGSTILALTTALCQAAPIVGVTATTNAVDFTGFDPLSKTLDFSNLTGGTLADTSDPTSLGWIADGSVSLPITINYALNGSYQVARFGLWNLDRGNSVFGLENVLIESSTDDITYTSLTGGAFMAGIYSFAQAPLATGNSAEIVNFNQVTASFFRFTVLSEHNGTAFPGYNTIMFDSVVPGTPELNPSTASLPLCFMSFLMLAGLSRRKSLAQG